MRINDDSTFKLIKNAIGVSTTRGKLIANNIANVNTEGYKRYYIDFDEALNEASKGISLKKTRREHIDGSNILGNSYIYREDDTSIKIDGNNVDIESEKVDQATNTMMYNALISRVNGKLSLTNYIISGGK